MGGLNHQKDVILDLIRSGLDAHSIRDKLYDMGASAETICSSVLVAKSEIEKKRIELATKERQLNVAEYVYRWAASGNFELSKNEHPRAHKMMEAKRNGSLFNSENTIQRTDAYDDLYHITHDFVIRHNWGAVMADATEEAGNEFSLPFPSCIFEFMINGLPVLIWAIQKEGCIPTAIPFVETPHGWWCGAQEETGEGTPFHFAWLQVIGLCIALDVGVTIIDKVAAPTSLNKKRAQSGKPPIKDVHIIDLARRYRIGSTSSTTKQKGRRLHFRRGHWRHYAEHKVWIRWTLVGNPDMGFVEKQYRI